jgi:quinol monooxygenase YgiN
MARDFLPVILENATAAVRDEPDCHVFHVMTSADDPNVFHFFEVYTNEAGLDAHREYPHYKKYRERADGMIADLQIKKTKFHQ